MGSVEEREEDPLDLAISLHGHLAPGLALGVRMTRLAMERLGARKGEKNLIGVAETSRCLADALQVTSGCTLGHANAFVENYGKLALSLARADTRKGIRVSLREEASGFAPLMRKWMMREGRLTKEEERELGLRLLELEERYFDIQAIELLLSHAFERSPIQKCARCGDLIPEAAAVGRGGETLCRFCAGETYYRPSPSSRVSGA
jgi:formylmethanofuran dehydrogenase subunit E